jgi:hypothetical protein
MERFPSSIERFPVESPLSVVIDLGNDGEMAKTPLSHRRKQVFATSSIELDEPPLTLRGALLLMVRDKASRPALLLVGEPVFQFFFFFFFSSFFS